MFGFLHLPTDAQFSKKYSDPSDQSLTRLNYPVTHLLMFKKHRKFYGTQILLALDSCSE